MLTKLLHAIRWYPALAYDLLLRRTYDPQSFWERRHAAGHDFWTVGRRAFDDAGNQEWYGRLAADLEHALQADGRDLRTLAVCEIGAGTGYWTTRLHGLGCQTYLGLDIAPSAVEWLRPRFPSYRFEVLDVGQIPIPGAHDLFVMMHVDEHIHGARFTHALTHIRQAMTPGAVCYTTYSDMPRPSGVSYVEYHTRADFATVFPDGWITAAPRPHNGDPMLRIEKPRT